MPNPESQPNADFDTIVHHGGLRAYRAQSRVIVPRNDFINEIDAMAEEIRYEQEYAATDPETAKAYHEFVERSWRELGYKPRTVAKMRSNVLRAMGIEGGTR